MLVTRAEVMKKLQPAHAVTAAIFVPLGYCTVLRHPLSSGGAATMVASSLPGPPGTPWGALGGDGAMRRGQGCLWMWGSEGGCALPTWSCLSSLGARGSCHGITHA